MALRLNFVHEIQDLARERQRDPLKLGMYVLGAIISLCLVIYFFRWQTVNAKAKERKNLDRKWVQLEKDSATARKRTAQIQQTLDAAAVLDDALKQRFFWGPKLQKLFESVPPQVALENLNATVDQDGPPDKPRAFSVTIDGKAAGPVPRIAAEDFRQHLMKRFLEGNESSEATFRKLEETNPPEQVVISGVSYGVASFSIALDVKEPALSGTEKK